MQHPDFFTTLVFNDHHNKKYSLKNYLILFLSLNILISCNLLGQRKLTVTITASNAIDLKKIKLTVEDGIKQQDVKPFLNKNSISISKDIISKEVILWVLYPKDSATFWVKGFLISGANTSINFTSEDSEGNPIAYCKSKNAVEYDKLKGYVELQNLIRPEQITLQNIDAAFNSKTNRDSLYKLGAKVFERALNKKLQFVNDNKNLYFSFLLFKEDIIPHFLILGADTLMKIFDIFPVKVKNSYEGKEVFNYLKEKVSTKKNNYAPVFTSFDTNKKRVALTDYRGKYVLISFWASWCGPCLEEIPMLQKISKEYPDQLQIISVSYDTDTSAFIKAVKKYKLTWINIFGDDDLINKYGKTPIPALYFLDRNGKVLFNSFEENRDKLLSIIKEAVR